MNRFSDVGTYAIDHLQDLQNSITRLSNSLQFLDEKEDGKEEAYVEIANMIRRKIAAIKEQTRN